MQKNRLAGIDVLRGAAALAVVVGHLRKWNLHAWETAPRLSSIGDAMGSWGVGLFFVLSGVCIHLPAARAWEDGRPWSLDVGAYAGRRFWRIYPPHLGILLLSWAAASLIPVPADFSTLVSTPTRGQLLAHLLMVHTFVPGATYSINAVLWTIAIEAHFYVLYPLLLAMRRRWSMGLVTAGLFLLSVAVRAAAKGHPCVAVLAENFPGRWWEWSLGAFVAEASTRRRTDVPGAYLGAACAGSLLFAALVVTLPHGILIRSMVAPPLAGAVVMAAMNLQRTGPVSATARWIGHRSYSIYLAHPICLSLAIASLEPLGRMPSSVAMATTAVTMILGGLVYYELVERRFLLGRSPFAAAMSRVATGEAGSSRASSARPV